MDEKQVLETIAKAKKKGAKQLDLSGKNLTSVPPELAQLTNLRLLHLSDNQLTSVPPELAQLTNLQALDLSNNQLTSVPPELAQLTNLQALSLSHNRLTAVPPELAQLTNLQVLDLSNNRLTAVPPELAQLTNLQGLILSNNQLTAVPPELAQLTNLRQLSLSNNRLTAVPPELAQLTNLRRLSLSNNHLTSVPPELAQLTNLQGLSLSNNRLTAVPPELAQLTNLQGLDLSNNRLTAVPPELAQLTNLQELYLSNNRLRAVPPELGQLEKLERLELRGNPLVSPPPEVVEQGTGAVLAYLRELAKGGRKRYEAKLLILGHGGEGKTCVSRVLRGLEFQHQVRTPGVDVQPWTFENPRFPGDADRWITVNMWDFEGQEINHQAHQFFLTEKSLYLLVTNGRREFKMDRAEYWLDTIRARAPGSRVILVASECEDTTPSWPLDRLKAGYGDLLAGEKWYFVVGCQSGKGVEDLSREIRSAVAGMETMGIDWPQTYAQAEARIREQRETKAHISRCDLHEIFRESGIDPDAFEEAAKRMASLGMITRFTDSTDLADFVVLNPQWLTKAVSRVMEDKQLESDHGEITHERMLRIWDTDYPGLYPIFHDCMRGFELCYDMEDKAGCLVPLWFGDAKPQIPWSDIPEAKERRIEYKLNIRPPKGIMSRFIVKTHHMIAKTPAMPKGVYWRNGVFLRTGEGDYRSEALCEFDLEERTLRITVHAAFPQNMIEQLHAFAKAVFGFFEGLEPERRYGCVKFEAAEQQCPEAHAERRILFALSRNRKIDCDRGWHEVDPKWLVYGFSTFGEAALSVEELRHELDKKPVWAEGIIKDVSDCLIWIDRIHTQVLDVRSGQKMLPAQMRQQVEMGMREYLRMLSVMLDDRDFTSAPGVVAIVPVDKSPFNPKNWFEKQYALTPYCESETGVHPVDFQVAIKMPRTWWERTAPGLVLGLRVLSAGLSIGFSALPLAIGDTIYDSIKNDVAFMKELTKHLELKGGAQSDVSEPAGDFLHSFGERARAADFREFSADDQKRIARQQLAGLLQEIAPNNYKARQWGRLRRVSMPDNSYRWLCEEHAQEYRR